MADQGAEVIKIEPPEGDMSRTFPPIGDAQMTPYFAQQNAGKRFCSVDLAAPGAPDLLLELLATCDVLVENYRPGVMAKFGLGPEEMCERFPALVYCSITGFGQDGPWADRRAYAPMGQLESGLLEYDHRKIGRPPHQPALVLGDSATAMMAANSINALLVQAARTGKGGHLDVCMVESLVYIQEWASTEMAGGWNSTNTGAGDQSPLLTLPNGAVWGIAGSPVAWFDQLLVALDRPDLADDPRFADPLDREANKAELFAIITEWAASFESFEQFSNTLEARSPFAAAELRSIGDLAATDWAAHRELFANVEGGFVVPARPARGAGIGTNGHVATRGADNHAVLADVLGYDDSRIDDLTATGVLVAELATLETEE